MRVIIKSAANAQTVLCDGPDKGLNRSVGPISPGMPATDDIKVQTAERLRAPTVKNWSRLNRAWSTKLTVIREMASRQAVGVWQLEHSRDCIRVGEVHFEERDPSGNIFVCKLTNAAIPSIQFVPMGVSMQVTYTIIGGAIV